MPVIDRGGVPLFWSETGQGPPVLLIMGHRYSSGMWYPVLEDLADRYRLIFFDNRGTGQSGSRPRTSIAELTSDALAVLDAAGADSAHLYGVSMGGGIALEFAIRYPDRTRSVILGCTTAKTEVSPARAKWMTSLVYRLPMPELKALSGRRGHGYGEAAESQAIARDQAILAADPFTVSGVIAQSHAIADYAVDAADVGALKPPALVLHGTQDQAVPYAAGRRLADMIPGARLVTFEGAGHNYFIAARAKANAAVDAFIREVESAR